jgi:dynactin-4
LADNAHIDGQYTYQIAFTNPLYDAIQVRLAQATTSLPPLAPQTHLIHIPTPHFVVNPLKDAWAYDEEDDYADMDGTEVGASDDGSAAQPPSSRGTLGAGKRSRLSVLATSSGGLREKEKRKNGDVEKRGNCSKVGVEVEVLPGARGSVVVSPQVWETGAG